MARLTILGLLTGFACLAGARPAAAAVLGVPDQHATIQAAVNAARPGDEIRVRAGTYCGAAIDKPVQLLGLGNPTIVGCDGGPSLPNGLRVGFFLPGNAGSSAASGTQVVGFTFDGRGISNTNLAPLAFGIFGRFAHDVRVVHNQFLGNVQAVTNTGGDRWVVWNNRIRELTVLDCTGFCTGGDGIVVQVARGALAAPGGAGAASNRPEGNLVIGNQVSGSIPDGFDVFGMVGILVFAADRTAVLHNRVSIPDNPNALAPGQGILITNICCGDVGPLLPGARNTLVAFNDASGSEVGIVVEGTGGQNTSGLVVLHNRGSQVIEDPPVPLSTLRFAPGNSKQRFF